MEGLELSSKVTTPEVYTYGNPDAKYKIAALDFGIKKNILRNFDNRDCFIKIFPAKTAFSELQAFQPDGYFISNGPLSAPAAYSPVNEVAHLPLVRRSPRSRGG